MHGCPHIFHRGLAAALLAIVMLCLLLPGHAVARQKGQLSPRQATAVIDARNFIEEGKPKQAVSVLERLAKSNHPPLIILSHLAWAQTETGDDEAAFETYQRAAALYPEDAATVRNLGLILLRRDDFTGAADTLVRAYRLQPKTEKEPALLALAASALIQNESYTKALPLLKQAGQDAGDMQVNWSSLAVYCCIKLGRNDEALGYSRECTTHHPESAEAWSLHSRVLIRNDAPLAAAAALETALSVRDAETMPHPMDEATAIELASLYARGHANAEAAQRLMESGVQDSAIRAARFHYLAGRYEAALLMLDSHSTDQEQPMQTLQTALLKGRILINLGRTAEAVNILTKTTDITMLSGDRKAANHLKGTALLLAGEALWMERSWTKAAATFDILATIPGYGSTGSALARAMRALIRQATEKA